MRWDTLPSHLQLVAVILSLLHEIGHVGKEAIYEGWNFNSGNYLFTTDTK